MNTRRRHNRLWQSACLRSCGAAALVTLLALPALAAAEPAAATVQPAAGVAAGTEPVAAAAPTGVRDLSAYKEEQVSGGALAAGAYMVMWVLVAAFVGRVAMRQSQTEAALRQLEDRVDASHGAS